MASLTARPYPVNAFHNVVRDAIWEVQHRVQAPDALISSSFLTAMSIAGQGHVDIETPTGQIRPVSLNLLSIANSGERKTATDSMVCAPIYEHDSQQSTRFQERLSAYHRDLSYWRTVEVAIQRKIYRAIRLDDDAEKYRDELLHHHSLKPLKPERCRIVYQSITERPFMEALQGDGKSLSILSDEGDVVLRGGAMSRIALLNKVWDGAKTITFDRADESLEARNPRVTVSFMVQEGVFNEFMAKKGGSVRSSGHLARYLVSAPMSTQGTRHMSGRDEAWVALPKFHDRLIALLDANAYPHERDSSQRSILRFSPEAKELWVWTQNNVEQQLQPGGYFENIKDFAAKSVEIVGRLAGIMHCFGGFTGDITADTMERAIQIVDWHSEEFRRLFGSGATELEQDVEAVGNYLLHRYWKRGYSDASRNEVRKCGPIRHQGRFESALDQLCKESAIWMSYEGTRKRFIRLNASVFGSL
jgi:hypothetical protein